MRFWATVVFVALLWPGLAGANVLLNPGFESAVDNRPTDWLWWDNTFSEAVDFAHSGARAEKFFGNWAWQWNACGVIQEFPAAAGDLWRLDAFAYHWSGDPLFVDPDPGLYNRLIMKIEFQDAAGGVTGSAEAIIVDPTTPFDTWLDVPPVEATAPANTASALAVFVYLQPNFGGGSAWMDDASFVLVPEPAALGLLLMGGLALVRRR